MISASFFPLSALHVCKRCLMWLTGYNFFFSLFLGFEKWNLFGVSGLTSYLQTSQMLVCIFIFSEIYLMWLIQRFKFWSNFCCSPSICRCQDLSIKRKYLLLEQIWAFVKETSGLEIRMPELFEKQNKKFKYHTPCFQSAFSHTTNRIFIFNWCHTVHLTMYSQAVSGPFINLKHSPNLDNQFLNRNSEMAHMNDTVIESSILIITIL